ncbi:MAG: hypothetical protein NWR54_03935, partial [Paracoccaceae bacterium]|nr:hypothetical protein [Paracoccaceae bacterium]
LMILENWIKTEENILVNFLNNNLVSFNEENENEEDEYENGNADNKNASKAAKYNSVLNEEAIEEKIKNFDFEYHINKTQEVIRMLLQKRPGKGARH